MPNSSEAINCVWVRPKRVAIGPCGNHVVFPRHGGTYQFGLCNRSITIVGMARFFFLRCNAGGGPGNYLTDVSVHATLCADRSLRKRRSSPFS